MNAFFAHLFTRFVVPLFRILRILLLDKDKCDVSVENKYKRKINVCLVTWQNETQDNILYNRKKYALSLQIEMCKKIEFLKKCRFAWIEVFRKTSVKPLKFIVNRINYSAFDSASDALSHALLNKKSKIFTKIYLFRVGGGPWTIQQIILHRQHHDIDQEGHSWTMNWFSNNLSWYSTASFSHGQWFSDFLLTIT